MRYRLKKDKEEIFKKRAMGDKTVTTKEQRELIRKKN
jgi:hypothetical protein